MSAFAAPAAQPYVRTGQTFRDYDSLRRQAQEAVDESGLTRVKVAELVGVTPPVITRALAEETDRPGRYVDVQLRIIEKLTGYAISDERHEVILFRVGKKAEG